MLITRTRTDSRARRALPAVAALAALGLLAGCAAGADPSATDSASGAPESGLAAGVAMPGYINDASFTQASYEGLLRAGEEYGVETTFVDGIESPDDMLNAVLALAQTNGLVIGSPTELSPALVAGAEQFPDTHFVLTDGELEDLPNTSYAFPKWYGPGYVAGAVAATLSETGTIGYIGGRLITAVIDGLAGYKDGALSVNPDIVIVDAIASMSDSVVTKNAATAQIDANADVIWGVLDSGILGIAQAIEASGKDVKLIGSISNKCGLPTVSDYDIADVTLDQGRLIENVVAEWATGTPENHEYRLTDEDSLFEFAVCPGMDSPEMNSAIEEAMGVLESGTAPGKDA